MKLLLDTCAWGGTAQVLREAGHDREGRVLITLDEDFGERAIVFGEHHSGIIRLVSIAARQQADYCQRVLEKYGDELRIQAIVTVDIKRTRVRLP